MFKRIWTESCHSKAKDSIQYSKKPNKHSQLWCKQTSMKWISYQISTSYNELYLINSGISRREREREKDREKEREKAREKARERERER